MNILSILNLAGFEDSYQDLFGEMIRYEDVFLALLNKNCQQKLVNSGIWICASYIEAKIMRKDLLNWAKFKSPEQIYPIGFNFDYNTFITQYSQEKVKFRFGPNPDRGILENIGEMGYTRIKIDLTNFGFWMQDPVLKQNFLNRLIPVIHIASGGFTSKIELSLLKWVVHNYSEGEIVVFIGSIKDFYKKSISLKEKPNPFKIMDLDIKLKIFKLRPLEACVIPINKFFFFRALGKVLIHQCPLMDGQEIPNVYSSTKPFYRYTPFATYLANITRIPKNFKVYVEVYLQKINKKSMIQLLEFLNKNKQYNTKKKINSPNLAEVNEYSYKDKRVKIAYIRYLEVYNCQICKKDIRKAYMLCPLCENLILCIKCSEKHISCHEALQIIIIRYEEKHFLDCISNGTKLNLYDSTQSHLSSCNGVKSASNKNGKLPDIRPKKKNLNHPVLKQDLVLQVFKVWPPKKIVYGFKNKAENQDDVDACEDIKIKFEEFCRPHTASQDKFKISLKAHDFAQVKDSSGIGLKDKVKENDP